MDNAPEVAEFHPATSDTLPWGLVDGMPNEKYQADPGTSKSQLDQAASQSMLHFWNRYLNPDREIEEETEAQVLGTAIHTAILEPDFLLTRYIESPKFDRRTKVGKELYAEFVENNPNKIALPPEHYKIVIGIRDAAHHHPKIGQLLKNGRAEQSVFARDKRTGARIKCRIDWLPDGGDMILDLKSTLDASPEAFDRSIFKYRYDVQAAWYQHVLDEAFGEHPEHWGILAFEKEPPYAMDIVMLDPFEHIEPARITAMKDFDRILHHRQHNFWPDYAMTPRIAGRRPSWIQRG